MPTTDNNSNSEYTRAEKAALCLIARAEQCSAGLALKLEKKKFSRETANRVISRLCELELVNDARFSRLWLESHIRLARTPRRLLAGLYSRGIDHETAEEALKKVLDEEAELTLLEKFAGKYRKKKSIENIKSLKYMLKNEGFSNPVIRKFCNED